MTNMPAKLAEVIKRAIMCVKPTTKQRPISKKKMINYFVNENHSVVKSKSFL